MSSDPQSKSVGSVGSWNNESSLDKAGSEAEAGLFDDKDDPFHRTAQKQQTGFRVIKRSFENLSLTADFICVIGAHKRSNEKIDANRKRTTT
jgi:hypothetical protein